MSKMIVAVLLAFLSACAAAPPRTNPHPWLKWGVGGFVRYRIIQKQPEMRDLKGEMSKQFLGVTDGKYSIRFKSSFGGRSVEEIQLNSLGAQYVPADPNAQVLREEVLKVNGKEYSCTVWGAKIRQNQGEFNATMWICDEVDLPLKIVLKPTKRSSVLTQTELVAVDTNATLRVAGRTLSCVKLEGTIGRPPNLGKVTQWRSAEVPGGLARVVSEQGTSGRTVTVIVEAVEFGVRK